MIMLPVDKALADEPVDGVLTREHLGRQYKRVQMASLLSTSSEYPAITDATVGDRFVAATRMAFELMASTEEPVESPRMVAAVGAALRIACGPGGVLREMLRHEIEMSCAPRGAFREMLDLSFAVAEGRSLARLLNGRVVQAAGSMASLPNQHNQKPPSFPESYREYDSMDAGAVNDLLAFYGLPLNGSLGTKKRRLAAFCNIPYESDS